jgi:hypothetical protein
MNMCNRASGIAAEVYHGFTVAWISNRHCERSEAIQKPQSKDWIASSLRFSQ